MSSETVQTAYHFSAELYVSQPSGEEPKGSIAGTLYAPDMTDGLASSIAQALLSVGLPAGYSLVVSVDRQTIDSTDYVYDPGTGTFV